MKIILGRNLRRERCSRSMSRGSLADKLRVTTETVEAWENGAVRIDAALLYQVARIFDIPVSSLFQPGADDPTKIGRPAPNADLERLFGFAAAAAAAPVGCQVSPRSTAGRSLAHDARLTQDNIDRVRASMASLTATMAELQSALTVAMATLAVSQNGLPSRLDTIED